MSNLAAIPDGYKEKEFSVEHHFVGNGYTKLMTLGTGDIAAGHVHNADHDSHLLIGSVIVTADGQQTLHDAPKVIKIKAGISHGIKALSPVLWACVWPNPENLDANDFDESVIQHAEPS